MVLKMGVVSSVQHTAILLEPKTSSYTHCDVPVADIGDI